MKAAIELARFAIFRRLERRLSVERLYSTLRAPALARARFNHAFNRPRPRPLPACFRPGERVCPTELRTAAYLNHTLEFFPDRLGTEKWIKRCTFAGTEQLREAKEQGRPVILAFCHFGPYALLRAWLRAAGFPAMTLLKGKSRRRSLLKRMEDDRSPFPGVPTAVYQDQLREALGWLRAGNPLLAAADGREGKQMQAAVRDNWFCEMATGPLRLARRHGARLFPCSITDEGSWRFRMEIGPPVPDELLNGEAHWREAGKFLFGEFFPAMESNPDQCSAYLLKRFQRV